MCLADVGEFVGVALDVFLLSLLDTLVVVLACRCSKLLLAKSVWSCLSASLSAGLHSSFWMSLSITWRLSSILVMSCVFVWSTAESRERLTSFSVFHNLCICSLVGCVPGNDSLMLS